MLDVIVNEITNLKWLILTMILVCTILCVLMFIGLSNFNWKRNKVRLFSLLYGLKTKDVICLSIMLTRCIYIIYLAINNENISVEYLITLIIMSIVICVLEKDYLGILTNILTSVAVYVIIYLQSSLRYFYNYVEHDKLVLIMVIALCIFTTLYAIYSLISSYNHMIVLNKKGLKDPESLKDTNKIKWPKVKQNSKLKSSSSN